jgi:ABC-type glycerol-3-phosphate transport system permease component
VGTVASAGPASKRTAASRGWRARLRPQAARRAGPGTAAASYLLVTAVALASVLPFLYVLSASFKDSPQLFTYPPQLLPARLYVGNYTRVLFETGFPRWVLNTLFVASTVTVLKVLFDSLAGYAFAKLELPHKEVLFIAMIAMLMIPFGAILIPLFFFINDLGLRNTYLALILPPLANPIGIFLMRQFIEGLPKDLENAARLDGVSEFGIYRRIILPLVKPGLVVLAVMVFLDQYMSFLWPLVATGTDDMRMVTTGLATFRQQLATNYGMLSAGTVMAMVPLIVVFLLLQRYFLSASLAGALKQ